MPKVDKLKKTTDARSAAHPISRPAKAASKKKKSTSSSASSHSESLGEEIDKLANPGKLKPIKPVTASKKATKKEQSEEQKLENETLTAARFKSNAHLYEDGEDDDMDADDVDDDEADEMARDEAAPISARMSKKILEQVHAQQREELEGEGIEEERQGSTHRQTRACLGLIIIDCHLTYSHCYTAHSHTRLSLSAPTPALVV